MDLTEYLLSGSQAVDPSAKADEETLLVTLKHVQRLLAEKNVLGSCGGNTSIVCR